MIFCVVPDEMAAELYDKLVTYYEEDPNVEVIVDRRAAERRSPSAGDARAKHRRETRDRRRSRIPGEFPPLGASAAQ